MPGVAITAFHESGSEVRRPARRNELLPAPDGPMSASRRGRSSFFKIVSTSISRPKKNSALSAVNGARPG